MERQFQTETVTVTSIPNPGRFTAEEIRQATAAHMFLLGTAVSLSIAAADYSNTHSIRSASYFTTETSLVASASDKLGLIETLYYLENPLEVRKLLYLEKDIMITLEAAHMEIIGRFGAIRPTIELVRDKEYQDWKTLFVTIPAVDEHSFDLLDSFLQGWAFYQSDRFKTLVTFSLA